MRTDSSASNITHSAVESETTTVAELLPQLFRPGNVWQLQDKLADSSGSLCDVIVSNTFATGASNQERMWEQHTVCMTQHANYGLSAGSKYMMIPSTKTLSFLWGQSMYLSNITQSNSYMNNDIMNWSEVSWLMYLNEMSVWDFNSMTYFLICTVSAHTQHMQPPSSHLFAVYHTNVQKFKLLYHLSLLCQKNI